MSKAQVETTLDQMKRSKWDQVTVTVATAGQVVVAYNEQRVSLVISSQPSTLFTLSKIPAVAVGGGITIPAGGAPLVLSLGTHGSIVKGPLFAADGTFPSAITYWESSDHQL